MVDDDARGEIERAISTGKKDHNAAEAYEQRILGKAQPHVAALQQCTGEVSVLFLLLLLKMCRDCICMWS